jgi:hypothetical protein
MYVNHKQVEITVNEKKIKVDEEIADLITELWKCGIETRMSCQNCYIEKNARMGKYIWIEFSSTDNLQAFMAKILRKRDDGRILGLRRRRPWIFSPCPTRIAENAYADFTMSIRFPASDLDTIMKRLKGQPSKYFGHYIRGKEVGYKGTTI